MAKIELLNSLAHNQLGVLAEYNSELGYDKGTVMVVPNELQEIQREYPILFRKHNETGRFFPNALLGFAEDENLYLDGQGQWRADYIPMVFRKGPFLISFTEEQNSRTPILSIDLEDPRVIAERGEKLFNPEGKPSDYLQQVNDVLSQLHESSPLITVMVDAFNDANLIEPVTLDIQLNNGETINFGGAYTIAEEKLQALDADSLHQLNAQGFLSAAYYIAGSLINIRKLIKIKNAQLR